MLQHLLSLFERDLDKLAAEIKLYPNEESLWHIADGIANSGGNLCLHLIGNLRTYIGATLGNSGYIRNREAEFSDKNVPRATLLEGIGLAKQDLQNVLPHLTESELNAKYPLLVFDAPMQTQWFLLHLSGHLNYHLGQINYHRRLLAKT